MDAERLIDMSRLALARTRVVSEVVIEAWQAQLLAQAIGGQLAASGPPELGRDALGLGEIDGPGAGSAEHLGVLRGRTRAAGLTGVEDPRETLLALGALLVDVGVALISVACATDEDGLYWHCIRAMDAADESADRVRSMLHRLSAKDLAGRDLRRPPGDVRARAGPPVGSNGRAADRPGAGRGAAARTSQPPASECGSARDGHGGAPRGGRPAIGGRSDQDRADRTDGPVTSHVPLPPRPATRGGAPAARPRTSGGTGGAGGAGGSSGGAARAEEAKGLRGPGGIPDPVDSTASAW
ncbi:DUF6099 family protein [Streptomyces sp. NPDC020412]|uniref:DUF6099 family protein n=1 Tax=Streptomyces sp. NPDC020412 TaxID=3365073 RepID=UPI0037A218E7